MFNSQEEIEKDKQGLIEPPEQKALGVLNTVAAGYGAGQLGGYLAGKAIPAIQKLGEAGAIFPQKMYHGTSEPFTDFQGSPNWFTTEPKIADE